MSKKRRVIVFVGFIGAMLMMEILLRYTSGEGFISFPRFMSFMDLEVFFMMGGTFLVFWLSVATLLSMWLSSIEHSDERYEKGISPKANLKKFKNLEPFLGMDVLRKAEQVDGKVKYEIALEALTSANISEDYAKEMLKNIGDYISISKVKKILRDPEQALPGGKLFTETTKMECPRCESHNIEVIKEKIETYQNSDGKLVTTNIHHLGYEAYCQDCRQRFRITSLSIRN